MKYKSIAKKTHNSKTCVSCIFGVSSYPFRKQINKNNNQTTHQQTPYVSSMSSASPHFLKTKHNKIHCKNKNKNHIITANAHT